MKEEEGISKIVKNSLDFPANPLNTASIENHLATTPAAKIFRKGIAAMV